MVIQLVLRILNRYNIFMELFQADNKTLHTKHCLFFMLWIHMKSESQSNGWGIFGQCTGHAAWRTIEHMGKVCLTFTNENEETHLNISDLFCRAA